MGATRIDGLAETYRAGADPIALVGSWNLLEIAVPGGSAAEDLECRIGDAVFVKHADD